MAVPVSSTPEAHPGIGIFNLAVNLGLQQRGTGKKGITKLAAREIAQTFKEVVAELGGSTIRIPPSALPEIERWWRTHRGAPLTGLARKELTIGPGSSAPQAIIEIIGRHQRALARAAGLYAPERASPAKAGRGPLKRVSRSGSLGQIVRSYPDHPSLSQRIRIRYGILGTTW